MKNITTNTEVTREANGGAKVYNCSFCHNYTTKSYWSMYRHAFGCSYCNSMAYNIGWNAVLMIVGKLVGI